jgi:hypothetical protein
MKINEKNEGNNNDDEPFSSSSPSSSLVPFDPPRYLITSRVLKNVSAINNAFSPCAVK